MTTTLPIETPNLSEQLRCPKGKAGKELGQTMYDSNKNMIKEAICALKTVKKNRVLEIGPGNGKHLGEILGKGPDVRYFGLDISETMIEEAERINKEFIEGRKALFELYDGKSIPFVHNFFHRILTVNTIYFWDAPELFLTELYRVLQPGGIVVIAFVDANTMHGLPFVDDSFELYDISKIAKLVSNSQFSNIDIQTKAERVQSKDEQTVDRQYLVITLQKKKGILEKERDIVLKKSLKKMKCHGH
ncbi:MAG: class I SAM-dependent methyltransferase [Bacteroidota bacterium]